MFIINSINSFIFNFSIFLYVKSLESELAQYGPRLTIQIIRSMIKKKRLLAISHLGLYFYN